MRGEAHMPRFVEMDDRTTLMAQMEQESGTVILINEFKVEPEDEEQFLKVWAADAAVMKQQPGFISTQLHKGIGGSRVFVNYAVWESATDFKRAFNNPEFQAKMKDYPPNAASPHLFQKVAVPRICVA
jgi:heme-degrading monooxygenase HmoA